jgi:hypothetical protein
METYVLSLSLSKKGDRSFVRKERLLEVKGLKAQETFEIKARTFKAELESGKTRPSLQRLFTFLRIQLANDRKCFMQCACALLALNLKMCTLFYSQSC